MIDRILDQIEKGSQQGNLKFYYLSPNSGLWPAAEVVTPNEWQVINNWQNLIPEQG